MFFHGDHRGGNPINLMWTGSPGPPDPPGPRSKIKEIPHDSGADSPEGLQTDWIDNPIEMDTSPLGVALGESVRNFPVPFFSFFKPSFLSY